MVAPGGGAPAARDGPERGSDNSMVIV